MSNLCIHTILYPSFCRFDAQPFYDRLGTCGSKCRPQRLGLHQRQAEADAGRGQEATIARADQERLRAAREARGVCAQLSI